MMLSLQSITLADLLLSRLLFADTKGMTESNLKNAVKAIAASELSPSEFSNQVKQAGVNLSEQGYTQIVKQRHYITDTGRQYILNRLRLGTLPSKLKWDGLKNTDWIAFALKLPPLSTNNRKCLMAADGLRGAILKHCYELSIPDFSTLPQVRDALLWQQLCDPAVAERLQTQLPELKQQPFKQGQIMSILLNDLLQAPKALPWEQALKQLVTKAINAKRTDPNELRSAILRQALAEAAKPPKPISEEAAKPPKPVNEEAAKPLKPVREEEFAEITLQAARETKDGRLGESKVFISRVWETLQEKHPHLHLSLEAFKEQLVKASQQQQLILSRADLAYALDPEDVANSEIIDLDSTFHFIRLD